MLEAVQFVSRQYKLYLKEMGEMSLKNRQGSEEADVRITLRSFYYILRSLSFSYKVDYHPSPA